MSEHSLSLPSRPDTAHDGDRGSEISVHGPVTSTRDRNGVTKRNIVPTTEAILALYQPASGPPYDLENPFDRTNMALRIRRAIDNREDRITATRSLYEMGLITGAEYIERTDEAAAQLRRHRRALFRLNEIGRN